VSIRKWCDDPACKHRGHVVLDKSVVVVDRDDLLAIMENFSAAADNPIWESWTRLSEAAEA
jgi:hypothetical protein